MCVALRLTFTLASRVRKRKVEEHDEGEHEGFDATQLKEHEEFTKVPLRLRPARW